MRWPLRLISASTGFLISLARVRCAVPVATTCAARGRLQVMTLANGVVVMSLGMIVWVTPIRVGMAFAGILTWAMMVCAQASRFLGLVGFIIYVGGALILFRYCFILSPKLDSDGAGPRALVLGALAAGGCAVAPGGLMYEFYWSSGLLLAVGVLLFLVIIRVVAMVDMRLGSVRPVAY